MKLAFAYRHLVLAPLDEFGVSGSAAPAASAAGRSRDGTGEEQPKVPKVPKVPKEWLAERNGVPPSPDTVKTYPKARCPIKRHWVSLEDLENLQDEVPDKGAVFIGRIGFWRKPPPEKQKTTYNKTTKSANDPSATHYNRTMVVMCLNSPPGRNTAIVLLQGRMNQVIFGSNLSARDRKDGFVPGAIVIIQDPFKIKDYFGSLNGLPILSFQKAMVLVDEAASRISMMYVPYLINQDRLQMFTLPEVTLELLRMSIETTTCVAYMCDSIGQKKDQNTWLGCCPCFVQHRLLSDLIFDCILRVSYVDHYGEKQQIIVPNFTSRAFTDLVTVDGINVGLSKAQLEEDYSDKLIEDALDKLIAVVNDNGGFKVMGWIRYGRKGDANAKKDLAQAGSPAGSTGGGGSEHRSGDGVFHLISVKLNQEKDTFKGYLVDVKAIVGRDKNKKQKVGDETCGDEHAKGGSKSVEDEENEEC